MKKPKHTDVHPFGIEDLDEFVKFIDRPRHTNFTNEITGSYHNDKTDWWVIAAVIIIVTVCAVILLRGLEAEALMN